MTAVPGRAQCSFKKEEVNLSGTGGMIKMERRGSRYKKLK